MPRTRIAKLTRVCDLQGRTLHFKTPALRRIGNHNLEFLDAERVPSFEGTEGWFEVECVRGGSRIVKVLRQVAAPGAAD